MVRKTRKMTSAARRIDRHGGFTLIELVMVLAIAAMVTAGAVGMMVYSSDSRQLRRAAADVEVLAKRARSISQLQQKPYALQFLPGKVRLLPLAEAVADERRMPSGRRVGGQRVEETPAGAAVEPMRDELDLEAELGLFVRRWGSDAWVPMNERNPQIWRFDPDGLCEPLGVRLTLGGSWIEQGYHPLNASVRELSTEFR